MAILYLLFGAAFGFALSRARATDYDTILAMFRGRDFHLAGVMGVAIVTSAIGLWLVRRGGGTRCAVIGAPIDIQPKPFHRSVLPAALIFGVGWGLTGTCPGTALAQLGELKTYAFFTIAGILTGTYVYGRGISHRRGGRSVG